MSSSKSPSIDALCLMMFCHCTWGLYPVVSRKLTAVSRVAIDSNVVLVLAKVLSMLLLSAWRAVRKAKTLLTKPALDSVELVPSATPERSKLGLNEGDMNGKTLRQRKIKIAFFWCLFASSRAITNLASCSLTLSYNIAIINSLTPIMGPLLEKLVLKTDLPKNLWPTVMASWFGMLIIAFAQTPFFASDSTALGTRDLLGAGLQLLSVVLSNSARILMKTSSGIFTGAELIQMQNLSTLGTCLVLVVAIYGFGSSVWFDAWSCLQSPSNLIAFLFLSVMIFSVAAVAQVETIRRLGPGFYGSFSSLRVLIGIAGSYLWLKEPVQNAGEWVGIVIVFAVMTHWVWGSAKESTTTKEIKTSEP